MSGSPEPLVVRVATQEEWHAALSLALAPLAASARGPLIDHVRSTGPHSIGPLDGLVVAAAGGGIQAACWAQPSAGGVAVCWPPRWSGVRTSAAEPTERAMLEAVASVTDAGGLSLCQLMAEDNADPALTAAVSAGFRHVATLRYVAFRTPRRPPPAPEGLRFLSSDGASPGRLRDLINATYLDSLDCPGLDGLRDIEDTLAGYRAIGRHDPSHWLIAHDPDAKQDVGVLLLAEHPNSSQLEIVYVGVAADARGQRHGDRLLSQAAQVAHSLGADEIVAAVDEANTPATALYERCGYRGWSHRHVYVRPHSGWSSRGEEPV